LLSGFSLYYFQIINQELRLQKIKMSINNPNHPAALKSLELEAEKLVL